MLYLLVGLVQMENLALIYQGYVLAGITWTAGTLVALVFTEILYSRVRGVNRSVEFEQASYGFRDKGVFSDGPESISPSEKAKNDKLAREKARPAQRNGGERAHFSDGVQTTRDKYRIHGVMGDDRILGDRY
jgi:hypothetical protein